jgi:lipoprotein-anchoring transpeptidase ErfK/SrfK
MGRRGLRSACMIGWAGVTAGALALAAGCTGSSTTTSAKRAEVVRTNLTITPANGARHVKPGAGIAVAARDARLKGVVVTTSGHPVAGHLASGGTFWHSSGTLAPSRTYTVVATGVGAGGKKITATSSFRTLTPRKTFHATVLEADHQKYGVGMPIVLTFSRPIKNRAAVERALSITSSKRVIGAWHWDGNKTVAFRTRKYWSSGTQVTMTAALNGVEGAKGVYGTRDLHVAFSIGPSLIARVGASTHYMRVYYKGRLYGRWPISTGAPGRDTANGHYLTIEKANPVLMSGPGYHDFPVPWSVRFTWSGNYIHDAYWSVGQQGYVNVSHGCVNMSPAHAERYYKLELPGSPVIVTGSPVPGTWDDGWTQWFLSWNQWLTGSALHSAVIAGPTGSTFVDASSVQEPERLGYRGHALVP